MPEKQKQNQITAPKEKGCLAGIRLAGHATPVPYLMYPEGSQTAGPWANLWSLLLLPTCPVNTGDLPERGDQRVLILHCEFQGHPFWHHKNHPDDKPSPPECISLHQVGEPPALLSDLLNRVQVE